MKKSKSPVLKYLRKGPRIDNAASSQRSPSCGSEGETQDPQTGCPSLFFNPVRPSQSPSIPNNIDTADASFYLSPLPTQQPGYPEWQVAHGGRPDSTPDLTPLDQGAQTSSHTQGPDEQDNAAQDCQTFSPGQGLEEQESTAPQAQGPPERPLANGEVRTIDSTGHIRIRNIGKVSLLWCFPEGEKVILEFNECGQPVGTSGLKFGRLAGQYIRSGSFVGLTEPNWRNISMPIKESIWSALMNKFHLEDGLPIEKIKRIAFMDFGHKRKNFKGNLKRSVLSRPDMTEEEAVASMPELATFSNESLEVLARGWFTSKAKAMALKNSIARSKHKCPHTSGSKSYPRVAHEMKRDTGVTPTRTDIYLVTHTRGDGTPVSEEAGEKMDMMRAVMPSTETSSEVSTLRSIAWSNDDPYAQAMGRPEYSGRVRGVGSGVLPTTSTPRSSATPATADEINVLRERLAIQEARDRENQDRLAIQEARDRENQDRFEAQERRLAQMQQLVESLMANQGAMGDRPG